MGRCLRFDAIVVFAARRVDLEWSDPRPTNTPEEAVMVELERMQGQEQHNALMKATG